VLKSQKLPQLYRKVIVTDTCSYCPYTVFNKMLSYRRETALQGAL